MWEPEIVLFAFDGCPVCDEARAQLDRMAIPYSLVMVNKHADRQALLVKWSLESQMAGWYDVVDSLPQIFLDGTRVGSTYDLALDYLRKHLEGKH